MDGEKEEERKPFLTPPHKEISRFFILSPKNVLMHHCIHEHPGGSKHKKFYFWSFFSPFTFSHLSLLRIALAQLLFTYPTNTQDVRQSRWRHVMETCSVEGSAEPEHLVMQYALVTTLRHIVHSTKYYIFSKRAFFYEVGTSLWTPPYSRCKEKATMQANMWWRAKCTFWREADQKFF